jgi:hypothetical protein
MGTNANNITKQSTGIIGNNIAVSTTICQITDPTAGRYRIWGRVRHTLEDGCKLIIGATPIFVRICQQAAVVAEFGPIIVDINNNTDDITLQLAVATGAADTASATIYAQRIS